MMMTLNEALELVPGAVRVGDGDLALSRVHTDTRSLRPGDFFVALKGENFDGHTFLAQARLAGASAAMAERGLGLAGMPGLQVSDSLAGLQALARGWRARHPVPLIAVTGSNGKTTVTQMLASILHAAHGDDALATQGNLNNHIGVPLTLLRLRANHRAAVLELGMNHPGEIAVLAALAQPTVALVNNAQREHQEFMASVEAVAAENGAVISSLAADGVAVFPSDDPQALLWRQLSRGRRVMTFGLDAPADVTCQAQPLEAGGWRTDLRTPQGTVAIHLQVAGRHNLKNALAACSAALAAGLPLEAVAAGLAAFRPVKGRSQLTTLRWNGRDATLIDDSYNANPDSVIAAIEVLASLPAPQWLILGDMGEVGQQGPAFHAEVGKHARQCGIAHVWCAGIQCIEAARAFGPGARHFVTVDSLIEQFGPGNSLPAAGAILVKGSRFMAMERVVQALQTLTQGATGGAACS